MPDTPVTLAAIRETRGLLGDRIHHTPMLASATAARFIEGATGVRIADGRLYLKAEHLQKTGAFKVRAALARISSLTADERARGAITISAGNAGQAYAWAGAQAGVPVTVVMPLGAVASKVAACRGYGAEVVLHGAHVGESLAHLQRSAGGTGPHARASVRRPRGPAGQRVVWPGDPRGPAGRRCRRARHRRGRPDRRGGDGDQGEPAVGPDLRRRAGGVRGDDPRPGGRRARARSRRSASPTASVRRRPATSPSASSSATSRRSC